ncbi:hypothetical protein J4734_21390 [Klebsiella pneumoniae]|uniref:Uncharacterized protein n=1 Tax=Klebsiella pneumoniae TaxID=573 RepID=A0A939SW75_KLEPN|nr:hypothetical protein [Klebsiella pneumoniae]
MVSARLDDVANFLPAWLSWLLLSLPRCYAGKMAPGAAGGAIAISTAVLTALAGSDRRRRAGDPPWRPSNDYWPARVEKPRIGDAVRDIAVDDISEPFD